MKLLKYLGIFLWICLAKAVWGQNTFTTDTPSKQEQKAIDLMKQQEWEQASYLYQKVLEDKKTEVAKQKSYYESQIQAYKNDLKEEQVKTSFSIVGFLLAGLAILAAVLLLIKNTRKNDLLRERQQTIEEQNNELQVQAEELRQQQEEISAQRDDIIEKNLALVQKNKLINDSMRVAASIQQSILPKANVMENLFQDHFVIFRPRDIVSGDFYWVERLNHTTIVAVVDCTGHGVPGAFISLITNMLLKEIVLMKHIIQPNFILEHLNEGFKNLVEIDDNKVNIGADVALCSIQKVIGDEFSITFAGARRPLLYSLPKSNEIHKMKGSRQFVGNFNFQDNQDDFENESIELSKGAKIFLFSDGFTDQNNIDRKKIGEQGLIGVIKETNSLTMKEQARVLEDVFVKYQGDSQQRDDMLMIGIKL
jgi:serine phosphatase RsbU (regulator of sigma subunit)